MEFSSSNSLLLKLSFLFQVSRFLGLFQPADGSGQAIHRIASKFDRGVLTGNNIMDKWYNEDNEEVGIFKGRSLTS